MRSKGSWTDLRVFEARAECWVRQTKLGRRRAQEGDKGKGVGGEGVGRKEGMLVFRHGRGLRNIIINCFWIPISFTSILFYCKLLVNGKKIRLNWKKRGHEYTGIRVSVNRSHEQGFGCIGQGHVVLVWKVPPEDFEGHRDGKMRLNFEATQFHNSRTFLLHKGD